MPEQQSGLIPLAQGARKAIALSVDQPDLIIADINGQTLDPLDAVRSRHGLRGHVDPDTPMIVLTERPDDVHRVRCSNGASAMSPKEQPSASQEIDTLTDAALGR